MKFIHISDTHIRNLKYHYEYRLIFSEMYEAIKKEKPDYIMHCGDLAHTKTQLSPEYFELAAEFLKNLADIAPLHIIPGNHDGNLKNSSRQDAITPIVEALMHPNINLYKNSGVHDVGNNVCLHILSVFDEDNWPTTVDESKINIAMYHGSINNSQTDLGFVIEHGEHPLSIFKSYDYAFLGDIHKSNQAMDHDGRARYCGSTVQQNHSETNDKGYLVWEIESKEDFSVRHVAFENPRPFVTIELTKTGRLPRGCSVPAGARLRLVSNNNLPIVKMKKAVEVVNHKFSPVSVSFLNRASKNVNSSSELLKDTQMNLRSLKVQESLIKEYLSDYEISEDLMKRIMDLNLKYNKAVEATEDVSRNIKWNLKSMEWDNTFNYGTDNTIDFEKLTGIVGIFGKNYSGKSSIVDTILYSMFNSTSKNERKNLNIINQHKDACVAKVALSIGDDDYLVERSSEKYIKKLKGEETVEAKTELDFTRVNTVTRDVVGLNGITRAETDRNIRKLFGTMEDFLLTSMTSQPSCNHWPVRIVLVFQNRLVAKRRTNHSYPSTPYHSQP